MSDKPSTDTPLEQRMLEIARLCAEDVNAINFNRNYGVLSMTTEKMAKVIAWRLATLLTKEVKAARSSEAKYWVEQMAKRNDHFDLWAEEADHLDALEAK